MKRAALCLVAVSCLMTIGCQRLHSPNLPWRTVDLGTGNSANPDRTDCNGTENGPGTLDDLTNEPTQKRTRCTSHEVYDKSETQSQFDLHIVEFDDQGLFWNRDQAEESLRRIRAVAETQDVLVLVFFHGWFNNADVCNGKLSCFRELVALVAEAERRLVEPQRRETERARQVKTSLPRRVIGVFGGWRGQTLAVEGLKFLTFWGRKSTAHTVGENGAATELIARLTRIVRHQEVDASPDPSATTTQKLPDSAADRDAAGASSLIVIGHSFGGALLMSAVGNELSRAAGEALALEDRSSTVTSRLADLIVLINPAVEAARFDNVRRAAANATFSPQQLPLLLTLSSEADSPNKVLFPLGQSLASSQKAARSREQWQAMIQSLGTFRANQTHRLIAFGDAPPAPVRKVACQCDAGIRDYGEFLLEYLEEGPFQELGPLKGLFRAGQLEGISRKGLAHANRQEFRYSRLEPLQVIDQNSPFMMVQVDDDVIGGHSDIFNPRIVDFLVEFLIRSEVKRLLVQNDLVPAQRPVTIPGPFYPQPGKPRCFDVRRSPDGVVSTVRVDPSVLPQGNAARRLIFERVDPLGPFGPGSVERYIGADEGEFQFTFMPAPATYRIWQESQQCDPFEMYVEPLRERSQPFGAYGVLGMADGIGLQIGGALSAKRVALQSSVIFPAARISDPTYDIELGYRGVRTITGLGYRSRQGTKTDEAEKLAYFHCSLELPGLRLFKNTWSTWLGLDLSPVAKKTGSSAWTGHFDLAVRLQLRLPRERWID